jgi:predicted 2-oxoglutarate/Fe(II)-dependent dioxygenase YbiX
MGYQLAPIGEPRVHSETSDLTAEQIGQYLASAMELPATPSQTLNDDLSGLRSEYKSRKSLSFNPYGPIHSSDVLTAMVRSARKAAPLLWNNEFPEDFRARTSQGLKYVVGGSFTVHADDRIKVKLGIKDGAEHFDWVVNAPSRQIVAILYLNDNYEGGELYFPDIKDAIGDVLKIKPKAGEIVVFGGDDRYRHGVKEITSGERFAVTLWFAPLPILPAETVAERRRLFELSNDVATMEP